MRINKFLAQCGIASRRKCEELIMNGEISVNGRVVNQLGLNIDEKKDIVTYNGETVKINKDYVYIKLHKPKGYICSANDDRGRKTIYSLINLDKSARLFSIGRLDYNTEGLIILTNDGDFANRVIHPSREIEKEYIVRIEGDIKESEMAVLRAGVVIEGMRFPSAKVQLIGYDDNNARLSVVIKEGLNRQVRRMFEAIGKNIILLKRVRIGLVTLGGLPRGKYKELTKEEIALLENC